MLTVQTYPSHLFAKTDLHEYALSDTLVKLDFSFLDKSGAVDSLSKPLENGYTTLHTALPQFSPVSAPLLPLRLFVERWNKYADDYQAELAALRPGDKIDYARTVLETAATPGPQGTGTLSERGAWYLIFALVKDGRDVFKLLTFFGVCVDVLNKTLNKTAIATCTLDDTPGTVLGDALQHYTERRRSPRFLAEVLSAYPQSAGFDVVTKLALTRTADLRDVEAALRRRCYTYPQYVGAYRTVQIYDKVANTTCHNLGRLVLRTGTACGEENAPQGGVFYDPHDPRRRQPYPRPDGPDFPSDGSWRDTMSSTYTRPWNAWTAPPKPTSGARNPPASRPGLPAPPAPPNTQSLAQVIPPTPVALPPGVKPGPPAPGPLPTWTATLPNPYSAAIAQGLSLPARLPYSLTGKQTSALHDALYGSQGVDPIKPTNPLDLALESLGQPTYPDPHKSYPATPSKQHDEFGSLPDYVPVPDIEPPTKKVRFQESPAKATIPFDEFGDLPPAGIVPPETEDDLDRLKAELGQPSDLELLKRDIKDFGGKPEPRPPIDPREPWPASNAYEEWLKREPGFKQEPGVKREPGWPKQEPGVKREPGWPKQEPGVKREPGWPKQEPGVKQEPGWPKQEPGVKQEPGWPKQEPGVKREPGWLKQEPGVQREPDLQEPGVQREPDLQEPGVQREPDWQNPGLKPKFQWPELGAPVPQRDASQAAQGKAQSWSEFFAQSERWPTEQLRPTAADYGEFGNPERRAWFQDLPESGAWGGEGQTQPWLNSALERVQELGNAWPTAWQDAQLNVSEEYRKIALERYNAQVQQVATPESQAAPATPSEIRFPSVGEEVVGTKPVRLQSHGFYGFDGAPAAPSGQEGSSSTSHISVASAESEQETAVNPPPRFAARALAKTRSLSSEDQQIDAVRNLSGPLRYTREFPADEFGPLPQAFGGRPLSMPALGFAAAETRQTRTAPPGVALGEEPLGDAGSGTLDHLDDFGTLMSPRSLPAALPPSEFASLMVELATLPTASKPDAPAEMMPQDTDAVASTLLSGADAPSEPLMDFSEVSLEDPNDEPPKSKKRVKRRSDANTSRRS